jgi:hypothetical protein
MIYQVAFIWDVYRHGYIEGGIEETRKIHFELLGREALLPNWMPVRFLQRNSHLPASHFFEVHKGGLIGVMPRTLEEHVKLKNQMEKDGELLPIHFGEESAYLFHCVTTLEAIDRKKSGVYRIGKGEGCSRPVFQSSFTTGHWFFRIPQSVVCFATQEFADFYHSNQMTGLELRPQPMSDC